MNSARRHRWVGTFVLLGCVIILTPALVYHYRNVPVIHWKTEPRLPSLVIPRETVPLNQTAPSLLLPATWVIEISGSFNDDSATRLITELTQQHVKAFSLSGSTVTHVYVGPLLEKSDADDLLLSLNKKMHITGAVVSYNPLQQ